MNRKIRFARDQGDHNINECDHTIHGKYIHHKPKKATDDKQMVKVRQQQEIRDLIVPNREPLEVPGILAMSEFKRLKKQAYVVTAAERRAMLEEAEHKKVRMARESEQRKTNLIKAQLNQVPVKGSTLEEVESEATKNNKYLLQRAYEMRQEQEDEVKNLNSLILASKCLAIREAQIAEKNLIQKEMEDEEKRLDMMMEQQRQIGLAAEKKKREEEENRNQSFVNQIQQQMRENEIQQMIKTEQKDEEAREINQVLLTMQQEERDHQRAHQLQKLKMKEELHQAYLDNERYKALREEEERLADLRLQEFIRKKNERETQLEQEKQANKLAKERDIARLREQQQQAQDTQALRDDMNAYRQQEEAEREWRRKEKEAAIKRRELNEQLKRDREKQIEDIRKLQAINLARDEEEFHKVAKMQYEVFKKEEEKKATRRENAEKIRKEILKQVNEKERERIELRRSKMEEGNALRLEQEIRDMHVQETLAKKLNQLREHNLPERSLADIQRQVNTKLAKMRAK